MVFNRALIPARDKNKRINTSSNRLFCSVLDERLINDWKQLFRHCLGCGERYQNQQRGRQLFVAQSSQNHTSSAKIVSKKFFHTLINFPYFFTLSKTLLHLAIPHASPVALLAYLKSFLCSKKCVKTHILANCITTFYTFRQLSSLNFLFC